MKFCKKKSYVANISTDFRSHVQQNNLSQYLTNLRTQAIDASLPVISTPVQALRQLI